MEKSKQMELEVLVAIRNNPKAPVDEFYKIFDCCWPEYRESMSYLYCQGLFVISKHETIPGLNRLELTRTGKSRETELLLELEAGLSRIISIPKKIKKPRTTVQKKAPINLIQI
ncbi:MAG TPA: hypothetical protein VK772_03275 [Puia sp.]|nr:hypothetical protein [Puia sp.]